NRAIYGQIFWGGGWFFNAFIPVNIVIPYFLFRDKRSSTYLIWGCTFALALIWYKFLPNVLSLSVYFYFYALIYLVGYKAKDWYIPSVRDFVFILVGTVLLIGLSFRFRGIHVLESDLNQIKFSPSLPYLLYSLPAMEVVLFLRRRVDRSSNRFVNVVSVLGKNSIWIYFGQMYSLTLLGYISAMVQIGVWQAKLPLMFCINLILALLFAYLFSKVYSITEKGFLSLFSRIKQYLSRFIIQGET
ncbi:MAG: hypothetical protein Q3993_07495, partial [Filifactor alocis]|nr:hypothetical protein [Filifactor alocis]